MKKAIAILSTIFTVSVAQAYELGSHARITQAAYAKSILAMDTTLLEDLGIQVSDNPFGEKYFDVSGLTIKERGIFDEFELKHMPTSAKPLSIEGWLMRGAIREDDLGQIAGINVGDDPHDDPYGNIFRVFNHFYDPALDRPLTTIAGVLGQKAPDWGTGSANAFAQPNTPDTSRRNHFTVFDAREVMYRALTGRDSQGNELKPAGTLTKPKDIRNAYWATTFRALGDIVHLVEDMAQPQHTRNDAHSGVPGFGHESVYEAYIEARATGASFFNIDGTDAPLQPLNYGGYSAPVFNKYSDFWSTRTGITGGGLADYSNRGFFSAGANLGSNDYLSPSNDPNNYTKESTAGLLPRRLLEKINFLRGGVDGTTNIRMTTEGLFDFFLFSTKPTYSLNRFNYDDMADLLIPRAVGYSAGLINYFFRGKIDFVPDTADPSKYVIKNLGQEEMKGTFTLYYDDNDDKRHPVPGAVWNLQIAKNGLSSPLVFSAPVAPAPKVGGEYMLVFNGDMGEETAGNGSIGAVAGKIVRPALPGFIFLPGTTPSDGIGGTRLIYQDNGLWKLSKESGQAAGNIDWKGWYVNGKPTKVITWKGPTSRYFQTSTESPGDFSTGIYQDGKLFSVAPARVLGAALTRDALGNEWLIVICQTADGDTVYRRPNTLNTAPDLYDAVQAPQGWRHVATLPPPQNTQPADRAWLFNGNGAEAQTMRRKTHDPARGAELIRLKMTINDTSARMDNLANTAITTSGSTVWNNQNCEWFTGDGPFPSIYHKTENTAVGETVVAVDYRDDQEILAKIRVNNSFSGIINGTGSEAGVQQNETMRSNASRKLSFGSVELILENTQGSSDSSATWDVFTGFTKADVNTTETAEILLLDLRSDLAIYRRFIDQSNTSTSAPDPIGGTTALWSSTSVGQRPEYQLQHKTVTQTFYSYAYNLAHSGEYRLRDDLIYRIAACFDNPLVNGSDTVTATREYQEGLSVSSKDGSVATDRDDNLFVSIRYLDENNMARHFNFLSGGDPVAVTGIGDPNSLFYEIAPK